MIGILLALVAVSLPPLDARLALHDAGRGLARYGDTVWPKMRRTRLRVELVEATREIVFCDRPVSGFVPSGSDPVTGCSLQRRLRELPIDVAAAGDLDGHSVIQIGTPDSLGDSRAEWTVTLLHEAFHLYQSRHPTYVRAVAAVRRALGVADGDEAWPLHYPFPYDDPAVQVAFVAVNQSALAFLAARSREDVDSAVDEYVRARARARAVVGAKAWLYYEFQVGQEGVAHWTELRLAAAVGRSDPSIAALAADRQAGLSTSLRAITAQGLSKWRRSSFYVLGTVEAAMLDRTRPGWRRAYLRSPFSLGEQLAETTALSR